MLRTVPINCIMEQLDPKETSKITLSRGGSPSPSSLAEHQLGKDITVEEKYINNELDGESL